MYQYSISAVCDFCRSCPLFPARHASQPSSRSRIVKGESGVIRRISRDERAM